ncbi:Fructose import ATP-binding protein FrcA [subsurface metagenome]
MERKIILEVKNLKKYFGGIKAIDGIDMKLYEKEIVAIVGDNGAGKSTLIKTITGIYKKDDGEIYINGREINITNTRSARENGIETVYQDQKLVPTFDASGNLFLGREKITENVVGKFFKILDYKYMKKETKKLLKKVGVEIKEIDSPTAYLSGGQRQGVVVGRAVYWGGRILILDEPTNNLGAKQEKIVIDLIKKIREEYNVSIIVITHNIAHVFELVDRIIILRNGKKVGERIKTESNPNEIISMTIGLVN